jgi:L-amino acid N-acyltransferase YncA
MRSGVSIREADPSDANAIGDCLRAAFEPYRVAYTREAYDNTMFTTETMRERFASMSVLVAVTEIGEIVGRFHLSSRAARKGIARHGRVTRLRGRLASRHIAASN